MRTIGHFMPEGDFRDWPAIEEWADRIARELKPDVLGVSNERLPDGSRGKELQMVVPSVIQRPPVRANLREMRAAVFHAPGDIRVEKVERPRPGPGEAVIRVT